jgi:hypothetical protein
MNVGTGGFGKENAQSAKFKPRRWMGYLAQTFANIEEVTRHATRHGTQTVTSAWG